MNILAINCFKQSKTDSFLVDLLFQLIIKLSEVLSKLLNFFPFLNHNALRFLFGTVSLT